MAFPASNVIPAEAYTNAKKLAVRLKSVAAGYAARLQAGNVSTDNISSIRDDMIHYDAQFAAIAAVPNIAAYAQAQEDDLLLDVVAEFNAMRTAIQAVKADIESTFPTHLDNGTNYLLGYYWNPSGSGMLQRTFAPAATATLAGLLNAVVATID